MQQLIIDKRAEGLADLVKQNRDLSTLKFDIWQKRPELVKTMQTINEKYIEIYHLNKYILTVTSISQLNEQKNEEIRTQIDDDCEWKQTGFGELSTQKTDDGKYICWKLQLHQNKFPFKSIKDLIVDMKKNEEISLVEDYRKA